MSKTLEQFEQYLDKMKKYEHINTLLYWDMRTCAPKLGQTGHIDALTYFSTESFAMSTSDELYGMLICTAVRYHEIYRDTHAARYGKRQTDSKRPL